MHCFSIEGKKFLFEKNSLIPFEIDDITWETFAMQQTNLTKNEIIFNLQERYDRDEIIQTVNELNEIQEDLSRFLAENKKSDYLSPNGKDLVSIQLQLSHGCNLKCRFCFADHGTFSDQPIKMSINTAREAVDFLVRNSGRNKNLIVYFSGGEPLINFDTMKDVVTKAREITNKNDKSINFGLYTNGLNLNDPIIDFLLRNNFSSINISLDGPEKVQDCNRPLKNGDGSFETVFNNIKKILNTSLRSKVSITACFTNEQINISDTFNFFIQNGISTVFIMPYYLDCHNKYAIREKHLSELRKEYLKIAIYLRDSILAGEKITLWPLNELMRMIKERTPARHICGAGVNRIVVSPSGDIYPCQFFDNKNKYLMGTIFHESNWQAKALRKIAPDECKNCWARSLCGEGCPAYSILFENNIIEPYHIHCKIYKYLIELAIWLICETESMFSKK